MMKQQEMAMEIAYWVEELGYDCVLEALQSTCHYWATAGDTAPPHGSADQWGARERALRHALWETET
jgi:hypothetical protein